MDRVSVAVDVMPVVSHAMAHNRISPVRELRVDTDGAPRMGAEVHVGLRDADGELALPWEVRVDVVSGPVTLSDVALTLDPAVMAQVIDERPATVWAEVLHRGELVAQASAPVTVMAARQWLHEPPGVGLELLAAHVMPNAPQVTELMEEVSAELSETTGSPSIQGYQDGPERTDEIVRAIWTCLQRRAIAYVEPPAAWSERGQQVRTPGDVLDGRQGTCLDLSVVMAAAMEQAGLRPLVWLREDHAFVAWWRHDIMPLAAASFHLSDMLNRLDLEQLATLEMTLVTDRPSPVSFATARNCHRHTLAGDESVAVLDVRAARRSGIVPIPAHRRDGDTVQVFEYVAAEHSKAPAERDEETGPQRVVPTDDRPLPPPRVQRWKNRLLDLSLRNPLLHHTPRGGVQLHLPGESLARMEDHLHEGGTWEILPSDDFDDIHRERLGADTTAVDLPPEVLNQHFQVHRVFGDVPRSRYAHHMQRLAHRARTSLEETGANNLYLALGMLHWEHEGRKLRSPLVLLPVTMTQRSRHAPYRIRVDDTGSSTPNYCLLEKLRQLHGFTAPEFLNPAVDGAGIDLHGCLRAIRVALAEHGLVYHVENTAHLSMLAFAKYRLWKDLDDAWETLLEQPLVRHLALSPTEEFTDPVAAPDDVDLDQVTALCPIDADASQAEAVAHGMAGRSFVLEGPPGTGKSQTIANLLARGVAEGRSVAFVAEKRAALDVVQARIEEVGLGAFALDLHDKGSKPTEVRRQIETTLDLVVHADDTGLRVERDTLASAGNALRRYSHRVHEDNPTGLSLYSAHAEAVTLAEDGPTLQVPVHIAGSLTAEQTGRLMGILRHLPDVADPARPQRHHPWGFVGSNDPDEVDRATVAELVRTIDGAVAMLMAEPSLTASLRLADTAEDLEVLHRLLREPLPSVAVLDRVSDPAWQGRYEQLMGDREELEADADRSLGPVTAAALDMEVADIHARAVTAATSSWFGRGRRLRVVAEELEPTLREGARIRPRDVVALTESLVEWRARLDKHAGRWRQLPGMEPVPGWNPMGPVVREDLQARHDQLEWAAEVLAQRRPFIGEVRRMLSGTRRAAPEVIGALGKVVEAWRLLLAEVRADDGDVAAWTRDAGLVARWRSTQTGRGVDDASLRTLLRWLQLRREILPLWELGLEEAHRQLLTGDVASEDALLALRRGLATSSVAERTEEMGLSDFDGVAHDRTVGRFGSAAERVRMLVREQLASDALSRREFSHQSRAGRIGELRREVAKSRRGLSVRDLMGRYGDLICQIMPCVLLSPDSLARFFPVGAHTFDILVFDEASQIRVAEAIGAMGRARSVVVVGDSRQMPPSSFAEVTVDPDLEDEITLGGEVVDDEESILSECVQARVPQRWLSWHYRSRDESLIAFSNHHYYDGKLSSFPAPTEGVEDEGRGITLRRVDGTFHRGGAGGTGTRRTNPVEAAAVVDEIARLFEATDRSRPPSVGVVTFNAPQRQLVEAMLRAHENPRMAESLDSDDPDRLFVKNLENVQGDERDIVLFSLAFSPDARGRLSLNFGPLNQHGGERRLNVAITRARQRVVLFSSFDPEHLRAEDTSSVGIKHLRAYMELARGGTEEWERRGARPGVRDPHREHIAEVLRERGLRVRTDIGLSEFRVDLAVADPDGDGSEVAVLLDGPGWAARRTVSDRDAMPTTVLARLMGWPAVRRVWLPQWLAQPGEVLDEVGEAARAVGAGEADPHDVAAARAGQAPETEAALTPESPEPTPPTPERSAPGDDDSDPETSAEDDPVLLLMDDIPEAVRFAPWEPDERGPRRVLDKLGDEGPWRTRVAEVLSEGIDAEGPLHWRRLVRGAASAFGLTRVSEDRAASIASALDTEPDDDGFVWPQRLTASTWRGFRVDPEQQRDIGQIPTAEVVNAMEAVCRASGGMGEDDLFKQTLAVFGFRRRTPSLVEVLESCVATAVETGRIVEQHGYYQPVSAVTAGR